MVQPKDYGDLIRVIISPPKHLVLSEVLLTPMWNRTYAAISQREL